MDDFFAPPAFNPAQALETARRAMRALGMVERGQAFEYQGRRVAELSPSTDTIEARLARRLAVQPEFDKLTLKSSADVRKFTDEVKARTARWSDE